MIRRVTPEQELASRTTDFARLRVPGQLFSVSGGRHFLLISRRGDEVEAVELDEENCRRRLVSGE